LIQEEIKRGFNSGNACYHSIQSHLLLENVKVRKYKTTTLSVVLYVWETRSLIVREERRLKVFENRFLRRRFGAKRYEMTGGLRKLHNEELYDL
jgi:hypothetical protein